MRRAVVAIVVLALVGGGGFGLGYLSGREVPPRPRAAPSVLPQTVLVPKVLHLPVAAALQRVMSAALTVGEVAARTGSEPGTIVAQFPPTGTSVPPGSKVNLFVSTSVYPRGAFAWCPNVIGTLPFGPGDRQEAGGVAIAFDRALIKGDRAALVRLADPSVETFRRNWTTTGKARGLRVLGYSAEGGTLVSYGCGPKVASRTLGVTIYDSTHSASAATTFYLIRRANGWKVWGSY